MHISAYLMHNDNNTLSEMQLINFPISTFINKDFFIYKDVFIYKDKAIGNRELACCLIPCCIC